MLFSSMTFVFLFLPIVSLVYLIAKQKLHNIILLVASVFFYAWGEPTYLAIMILTILINYFGALLIVKYPKYRNYSLFISVMLNLSFLAYFKYANFFIENINSLHLGKINPINVVMPIGISFYTFQAMSYLIDVYRNDAKVQRDIYKLSLYVTLFPQLVAGPIVKYKDVVNEIDKRTVSFDKVVLGISRFIIGLAKKMLIANTLGLMVDRIFSQSVNQFDTLTAWAGAIFYSLQLYYDFSGYSDMAIGLGLIFGFRFMENFNYPYISKSITEFWRRWHISLSTWFKEYLYIPLGGNRIGKARTYVNLFIVFLATGFWHGASWNFIFWGLWHGTFIIIEKMVGLNKDAQKSWQRALQHLYTIFVFVIGWVMFRANDMDYAFKYIRNMFGLLDDGNIKIEYDNDYYFNNLTIVTLVIGIICACPLFKNILDIKKKSLVLKTLLRLFLLCIFVLSAVTMAGSTYNPFIYFRF